MKNKKTQDLYCAEIYDIDHYNSLLYETLNRFLNSLLNLTIALIPDPEIERKRQRIILSGDVPSPAEEHTGCYFYDRCPKRKEHCKDAVPPLEERGEGHRVACFEV